MMLHYQSKSRPKQTFEQAPGVGELKADLRGIVT